MNGSNKGVINTGVIGGDVSVSIHEGVPDKPRARRTCPSVFVSYRRSDSSDVSGRLYDWLADRYGPDRVFKDVNNILPGKDFLAVIREALDQCEVLLVVIGPAWASARDASGRQRLAQQSDFVRLEIETAFALDLVVIPVTVRGATMPAASSLPEPLARLTSLNAVPIRPDPDFRGDIDRLCSGIDAALGG